MSEFSGLVRVYTDDVPQKNSPVRLVVDLLRVEQDLVELTGFGEASHNLVGDVSPQVDGQRKVVVSILLDKVTELFAAVQLKKVVSSASFIRQVGRIVTYLVLLQPSLQKFLLALDQDRLG